MELEDIHYTYKLWNNSMKDNALKVARSRMADKVLNSFRSLIWEKAQVQIAFGGVNDG